MVLVKVVSGELPVRKKSILAIVMKARHVFREGTTVDDKGNHLAIKETIHHTSRPCTMQVTKTDQLLQRFYRGVQRGETKCSISAERTCKTQRDFTQKLLHNKKDKSCGPTRTHVYIRFRW